jgi:hypothetical protein
MSPITAFYNGRPDAHGRTVDDMIHWTDDELEAVHNYIQWLFPLHEPSGHSRDQHYMTPEDMAEVRNPISQAHMNAALARMRSFYGLDGDAEKQARWCNEGDHNNLRVTRIIRSLRLFGLDAQAELFYQEVAALGRSRGLSEKTLEYWDRAAHEPATASMSSRWRESIRIDID